MNFILLVRLPDKTAVGSKKRKKKNTIKAKPQSLHTLVGFSTQVLCVTATYTLLEQLLSREELNLRIEVKVLPFMQRCRSLAKEAVICATLDYLMQYRRSYINEQRIDLRPK